MPKRKILSILILAVALVASITGNAFADFTVQSGETYVLTAGETLTVDGNLIIEATGTLDASAANTNISLSGNWANSGTFTPGTSSTVTFTDNTVISNITGNTSFYNFTCETAGKQFTFEASSTQTTSNTLTLNGQASGTEIQLRSSAAGTRWTFDVTGGAQTVEYVDVQDSNASSNDITANNSANAGNNDDLEASPHWIFSNSVLITSPSAGSTVGRESTLLGFTTNPGTAFTIQGTSGGGTVVVASGTSDSIGNFRVSVDSATLLDVGANTLRPYVGINTGSAVNITVVASPAPLQVPTASSPSEGATITTNPFTISGSAVANTEVRIQAVDANSDLVLNCGSATSNATGAYSISCDAVANALAAGANVLTVTTYDGSSNPITTSDIINVIFTDPFGIVFDSVSNNPIENATATLYYDNDAGAGRTWIQAVSGTHIVAGDSNPQTTAADGFYSYNSINGDFFITIAATGYDYPTTKADADLPAGRTIITPGSRGEPFTVAGVIIEMDHPMDATGALLKIEKDANKKEVSVGDVVTYTVTIENTSSGDVTDVFLEDKIPPGFKYISGKSILDNQAISNPIGNRPLTFNIGTIEEGATKTLKYQLVVGSGVTFGDYKNKAFAKYSNGMVISNNATETVKVIPDPLFDLGATIGKVFHDRNENGIQDLPYTINGDQIIEEPIGNIQIVTEEGTVITTDKDGKYHLAGIVPGRHLFRLDERTLPKGAYLTTDKVKIVDITPGILAKVNFGVKLPGSADAKKTPFKITQDRSIPSPRLNVSLFNDELIIKDGNLKEKAEFRIFTNYHLFIEKWKLEVLDKDTKRVVRTFKGIKNNIFEPIYWDGKDKHGKLIQIDRNYAYRLVIIGARDKKDVTRERLIKLQITNSKLYSDGHRQINSNDQIAEEYRKWLEEESRINNLEKQVIKIEGETINVHSPLSKIHRIRIIKSGKVQAEILIIESGGLTAKDLLETRSIKTQDSQNKTEIILPRGEYSIEVHSPPFGNTQGRQSTVYGEGKDNLLTIDYRLSTGNVFRKNITIGDDYLFFVGLGDAKMGYTFNRGNIEPVQQDDKFKTGFWSEGKVAYYLKGKIKGKYLITSSFDSERDKKELFKNLDPDKYYPVYGDSSSMDYKATDTQGMLYLLIEWDKSSALWGNYNTAFSDTEFANFSRTLYGGKVHLESVSTTKFGESNTKLVAFRARAQQKAAHNEFTGTGGSLYYIKHKNVVEGSDKVKIEIRDKISGLVLATDNMKEGTDYEMDYSQGRIIFWRPVSSISESSSIISSHLLDGNPVYVVVDYEYEVKDKYDKGAVGARIQQSLSDYLIVGGTYVKEEQQTENYELKGVDAALHLGKDIKLRAEYAESGSEAMGSFISTDGGLSFTELPTAKFSKGKAYGLKGDAHLFSNKLGLSGYYKWIDNDFSTSATSSQQGKELIGFGATYDPTPKTRLSLSHDIQKLIDDGNPQTQLQVGATKTETTSAQITHDIVTDKLKLTAEMRHQKVTERKEEFESETNTEEDALAVKADYKLTDKIDLSLEQQATLKGASNHQTTAGIMAKVSERLSLRGEETVGTQGTATSVGVTIFPIIKDEDSQEKQISLLDNLSISGDYTRTTSETGEIGDIASLGASAQVDDKTEVHGTYAVTDSMSEDKVGSFTFGSKRKINDEIELTTGRTFATSKDNVTKGTSYGLVREKDGRTLEGTYTQQHSESASEISNSNIFGLSSDINDRWLALGTFERGIVQNHDGTQTTRHAGSLGLGFVDKDLKTEEVKLKASSKIEIRLDGGQEDKRQYLLNSAIEGKLNPNTTLFAKANLSQTKNITTDSTTAQFKELVFGTAYRPIDFDWLNFIAKYTYLEDDSPASQSDMNDIEAEKAHVLAGEGIIDLTDKWQLSEKLAYKMGEEKVTGFEFTKTSTWLWLNRLNYKLNQDWKIVAEYRILTQKQAEDQKHGALVEVAREIGEFIQVGVGYNFTDFNDDLTDLDYTSQGPFARITGKLYDRTPEEIERARQKIFERRKERIIRTRVRKRFSKEGDYGEKILALYTSAAELFEQDELDKAEKKYTDILEIIFQVEIEEKVKAEEEIRKNKIYSFSKKTD